MKAFTSNERRLNGVNTTEVMAQQPEWAAPTDGTPSGWPNRRYRK